VSVRAQAESGPPRFTRQTMPVALRLLQASDADALVALLPDLGYTATAGQLQHRLSRLREWPDQEAFVAELDDRLVGLCHVRGDRLVGCRRVTAAPAAARRYAATSSQALRAALGHASTSFKIGKTCSDSSADHRFLTRCWAS